MTLGTSLSEELRTALDQFHSIDWTFEQAKTNYGLHSIHPYPARFVPQIPRNLIQLFQPVADGPVLDPFCGCGTTLVESQAKGIASFGLISTQSLPSSPMSRPTLLTGKSAPPPLSLQW